MRKYIKSILFAVAITVFFNNCEVDDICIEKVLTPRLVLKFFDETSPLRVKSVKGLYVWAEAKDTLYKGSTVDSILLPLNTNAIHTRYLLSVNKIIDTLDVYYEKENVFVSRSCGYKTTFTINDSPEISHHWTKGLELINIPQSIKDESKAHVKIYH